MKTRLIASLLLSFGAFAGDAPAGLYEQPGVPKPECEIDRLVFSKLAELGVQPALCSDTVFVRRAYLDVIGKLPTMQEARDFLQDRDPKKRQALIDRLLARDEFADYWAMKWGDLLRVKAEFPINLWPNAAQAYHQWIRTSIHQNKPYDRFVRELLTSNGSNFRVAPVNFYRAMQNRTPDGIAAVVALTFMGSRVASWDRKYLPYLSVFFAQISYKPTREWKEEIAFWDPDKVYVPPGTHPTQPVPSVAAAPAAPASPPAATLSTPAPGGTQKPPEAPSVGPRKPSDPAVEKPAGKDPAASARPVGNNMPVVSVFPDGTPALLYPDRDPREIFADWLISPENPWFAKNIVNRIWSWLLGRGIVHEPDDIRPDNPPCNPELLACLEKELIASNYDLKHIYRLILHSKVYQLSSMTPVSDPRADVHFARYPLRRMEAEVLIDAICQVTGTKELYTSPIPEPFTFIPPDLTAVAIPDGSITSPFLELFGRSPRDTGLESERSNKPMPAQRLHMLNSSHIQRKLEESAKMKAVIKYDRKPREIVAELYLTILSRLPTETEMSHAETYAKSKAVKGQEGFVDLAWALLNSIEFLYRH